MARYLESRCKLCHRCNEKLMLKGSRCLTPKCAMERRRRVQGRRRRVADYGLHLIEKQKVRYTYGVLERQFKKMFVEASRQQGITGDNLLVMLEKRLDNVVFRMGFADSRAQARQLVQHGHFLLNGRKANIPSIIVKEGDTIAWKENSKKTEYYKQLLEDIEGKSIPGWLNLNRQTLEGQIVSMPTPDDIGAEFDGQAVVEYYSR